MIYTHKPMSFTENEERPLPPENTSEKLSALRETVELNIRKKDKKLEKSKRSSVSIDYAHTDTVPVVVNINQSESSQSKQSINYSQIQNGKLTLSANSRNTIDILPTKPNFKCPFIVTVNGTPSHPQASPVSLTPKATDTVKIKVLEPICTDNAAAFNELTLDAESIEHPEVLWTITQKESFHFPFSVTIYSWNEDSKKAVPIQRIESKDGKTVALSKEQSTLIPGLYFVSVQPSLRHFPVAFRLQISSTSSKDGIPRTDVALGMRYSNLYRYTEDKEEKVGINLIPVKLKEGQQLNVIVEEETESYNQRMFTIGEGDNQVPANVIFNTPYLSMNIGTNDTYVPSATERFPNALFAYKALEANGLAKELAEQVVSGLTAYKNALKEYRNQMNEYEKIQPNPHPPPTPPTAPVQFRWNHVTFMYAMKSNGDVPDAILNLDTTSLTTHLEESIEIIMNKPYRNSDALEILDDLEIKHPQNNLLHITKNECLSQFYKKYEDRWKGKQALILSILSRSAL